jgi:hypothetical protein
MAVNGCSCREPFCPKCWPAPTASSEMSRLMDKCVELTAENQRLREDQRRLGRTAMTDHAQQCEQLLHDTRLRLVKAGSLKRLAQQGQDYLEIPCSISETGTQPARGWGH